MKRIFSTGGGVIAILLASMILFGCQGVEGGDTENIEKTEKYDLTWDSKNESTDSFMRVYKTFGGAKVDFATVEVTAHYPENGWSGVAFGITEEDNKANFFVLGMKTSNRTPYYYLSYFKDVNPEDITSAETFGTEIEINPSTPIPSSVGIEPTTDGVLKAYVKVSVIDDTNLEIKAGPAQDNLTKIADIDVTNISGFSKNPTTGVYNVPASATMESAKAKIGIYGQISKAPSTQVPLNVKTRYLVVDSDPKPNMLAADAE